MLDETRVGQALMDAAALRWTLAIIGLVLLIGIYLYGAHQNRLRKRAAMDTFTREEIDSAFIEDEQLREELENLNQIMNDGESQQSYEKIDFNPAIEANIAASKVPTPDLFIADIVAGIEENRRINYQLKHADYRLITGEEISNAVQHTGLGYDAEGYLEFRQQGELVFTVASLSAPGHFSELDDLEFATLGLIAFIDLDTNPNPSASYEIMLKKIDELVRVLEVKVYQSSQDLLTITDVTRIRKKLQT